MPKLENNRRGAVLDGLRGVMLMSIRSVVQDSGAVAIKFPVASWLFRLLPLTVAVAVSLVFDLYYVGVVNWSITGFNSTQLLVSTGLHDIVRSSMSGSIALLGLTLAAVGLLRGTLLSKSLVEEKSALVERVFAGLRQMTTVSLTLERLRPSDDTVSRRVLERQGLTSEESLADFRKRLVNTITETLGKAQKSFFKSLRELWENRPSVASRNVRDGCMHIQRMTEPLLLAGMAFDEDEMEDLRRKMSDLTDKTGEASTALYRYCLVHRFLVGIELPLVLCVIGLMTALGAMLIAASPSSSATMVLGIGHVVYVGMLVFACTWFIEFIVAVARL